MVCSEGVWRGGGSGFLGGSLVVKNAVKYVCHGRCEIVTGKLQIFGSQNSAICRFIGVEFSDGSLYHGRADVGVGCDVCRDLEGK